MGGRAFGRLTRAEDRYWKNIAEQDDTPPEVLDQIARMCNWHDWSVRAVAKNPHTRTDTLDYLLALGGRVEGWDYYIANHPSVSQAALVELSMSKEPSTRRCAAGNTKTPVHRLRKAVYDPDGYVARAAILNPSTPLDEVIRLREIETEEKILKAIEERIEGEGVVGLLDL